MFTAETLDFLAENRVQNNRAWYQQHRDVYLEKVVRPFAELVETLTPAMEKIDPHFDCVPAIGHTISRINRDTRFSADKSLYRETAWCLFMRSKKLYHGLPAFFFEISPDRIRYGCGYYQADSATLDSMRRLVLAGDKAFLAADRALKKQKIFTLEGPLYKRSRFPDQPEALRFWLDRRDLCLMHEDADFAWLFSDRVAGTLQQAFAAVAPVYRFWLRCEEQKEVSEKNKKST
ncbi:MAG: DUF2461 domain-containing protein [Clostridia bacterium]|nr:DUF2461 domain-containing protein [Clostridia bacterium]